VIPIANVERHNLSRAAQADAAQVQKKVGSPARASLWFGAALYVNSALLFLATPVFTRLLTPGEYGEVVLYNSWATVLGIFATLSLSSGVFYNAMLEFGDDLEAYASSMIGLTTLSVLVFFFIFGLVIAFTGDFTHLGLPLLAFMFATFLFGAALTFWQAQERFHYRYRTLVGISIPSSVIGISLAIALVTWVPTHRVDSRIIAVALPGLLVGMILCVVLLRRGKSFYSGKYWSYALAMSIPLLPHYLSQTFVLQFDRFAIEHVSGKVDVGIYGLAYAVASAITLFWTAINASWVPWMLKKLKDGRFDDIATRAGDLVVLVAAACILLALAAPEVVGFLAPASYRTAAGIVPLLLLASYLQFSQSFLLNVQTFRKRTVSMSRCSVLAAAINIAGNIFLIGIFGVAAAAYVIVATQLFQLVFHYAIVRGRDRIRVIDGRFLAGMTCGTASLIAVSILMQEAFTVRLVLFVATAAVLTIFSYGRVRPLTAGGNSHG
jgi:O-antigen/teichoic acid export membrane protein